MTGPSLMQAPSCLSKISNFRPTIMSAPRAVSRALVQDSKISVRTASTAARTSRTISSQCRSTPTFRISFQSYQPLVSRKSFSSSQSRLSDSTATQLTWNDFLQLRKSRRYVNLVASIATALTGLAVTVPIMAQYEVENQIAALTGLDPFIAIGLTMTAVGGVGWLMGPFVGNTAFGLWKRNIRGEIARVCTTVIGKRTLPNAIACSRALSGSVTDTFAEGKGLLRTHKTLPRRPYLVIRQQPCARLLRREDRKCGRLQEMAEGSTSFHQEEEQEPDMMDVRAGSWLSLRTMH